MNEDVMYPTYTEEYIADPTRCEEIVVEIKAIQKSTLRTVLASAVEIGRLLTEAKSKVLHGAWGDWLNNNFSYSQSTANNLMRLYSEYGVKEQLDLFFENKLEIFGSLTPTQALALLPLPERERREFIETHDMEQTSVRDIEREVKARKEAEAMVEDLQKRLENFEIERGFAEREIRAEYEARIEESEDAHSAAIKMLNDALAEAQDPKSLKEEKAKFKKKIEEKVRKELSEEKIKLEKDLTAAQKANGELEEKLAAAEKKAREDAAAEYTAKLLELEERARSAEKRADEMGDATIQKFALHFENFQREWNAMQELTAQIRDKDPEKAEKLAAAVRSILTQYAGGQS